LRNISTTAQSTPTSTTVLVVSLKRIFEKSKNICTLLVLMIEIFAGPNFDKVLKCKNVLNERNFGKLVPAKIISSDIFNVSWYCAVPIFIL